MKRMTLKLRSLGFIALLVTAVGGALAACSTQNQATAPQTSPTATTAGSPTMDHGNMSGMTHSMNMALGPADADFDLRFVDAMTPHHQGALVMAMEAKQKSKRPEIQTLAAAIISAQDKEIAQMQQWRKAWYPKASAEPIAWHAQMGHSMRMTEAQKESMMMSMSLGAADAQFDLRFLNAMIPHHQGAVVMAMEAKQKSKRPEIRSLANAITVSQKAEISQMEQWRKAWYKQ